MKNYFYLFFFTVFGFLINTLPVKAQHHNAEDWPEPIHDNKTYFSVEAEQLEYRLNNGENTFNWDVKSWVGGDYNKFILKTEGEIGLEEGAGEAEIQGLYSRNIAPFWDLQVGVRYDRNFGENNDKGRGFAVIGIEGVTPYFIDIEASLFVSEKGDISARLKAEKEFLLSQKLILQPQMEVNLAAQQVEDFGVGTGLNEVELGLRLKYEISKQFTPYLGINWQHKFAGSADFAQKEGENIDNFSILGGVKLSF
jgi:copper resistance protein B